MERHATQKARAVKAAQVRKLARILKQSSPQQLITIRRVFDGVELGMTIEEVKAWVGRGRK